MGIRHGGFRLEVEMIDGPVSGSASHHLMDVVKHLTTDTWNTMAILKVGSLKGREIYKGPSIPFVRG